MATDEQNTGTTRDRMVDAFVGAWNTTDETERGRLLEQCWAEDGIFSLPTDQARGREALAALIGNAKAQWKGGHVRVGAVDEHPYGLRYAWTIFHPDGSIRATGMHIAERSGDGRLQKMIAFYGPCPDVGGA